MNPGVYAAFLSEIVKVSEFPIPDPPGEKGQPVEGMSKAKWKQTAIDLPLVIVGSGLGWGLGQTASELFSEHAARHAWATGQKPAWIRHLPVATGMASSLGSYALGRAHSKMKERREAADAADKVVL